MLTKSRTQPQQAKMINDTEKRLNLLFDMLNCETLSETSHARVLEIVKGSSLLRLSSTSY